MCKQWQHIPKDTQTEYEFLLAVKCWNWSANRYNDVIFPMVPSRSHEWKYIYTTHQHWWCRFTYIKKKERRGITDAKCKLNTVQPSSAPLRKRAEACTIQFNLFATEIYMHCACPSSVCSMQSLSTNDYSCANTLFYTYY